MLECNLVAVKFDGCKVGIVSRARYTIDMPIYKPWMVKSNMPEVVKGFEKDGSGLTRICDHIH